MTRLSLIGAAVLSLTFAVAAPSMAQIRIMFAPRPQCDRRG